MIFINLDVFSVCFSKYTVYKCQMNVLKYTSKPFSLRYNDHTFERPIHKNSEQSKHYPLSRHPLLHDCTKSTRGNPVHIDGYLSFFCLKLKSLHIYFIPWSCYKTAHTVPFQLYCILQISKTLIKFKRMFRLQKQHFTSSRYVKYLCS